MFRKKKKNVGRIIPPFFYESSESDRVFNYFHDSNSIFRARGINSEWIRARTVFISVYVDDIKLAGKKQNVDPVWKVLNKEDDLGEPTSFLDNVYLGCTQRQCEISKDIVDKYRAMFESRISAARN